ncbi:hypothetical protein BP6252_01383 [Coleophoma cylindrospora]|uniref:WHIM1 domain-containing protein n=1 Tax=Coleophoma cylindrospora TaxID=1849047 RepID=A0A3D8ST58_9HELO|nr:hypothetical protein BP6252_01383 [Coleophoma cylindrospora]
MSDSSDLSSAPSDSEESLKLEKKDGILKFFSKATPNKAKPRKESTPPRKREPSPPHEYVLTDNPDIAFIVMFRSRFTEAFPKSLANFGPQELERSVVDTVPGEIAEHFLCALLGLLLNRKQDVKAGHYNRALEEAIQTHKSQWAKDWESKNPLSGGNTFSTMSPTQRLTLLRTLVLWSLSSSDVVKGIITASYKQSRHEDDLNQPLSVQPWGADGDKRRYYLIEGLDDTHFRVYRESNHTAIKRTWWSVAGDIEQIKVLAEKLRTEDGGQKARALAQRMLAAVPRFEATEEKRKRREYRQARKQQFKRPEPGFSMYEGRTRGKRMRYTYSDDEDDGGSYSDATSGARRSTRNTRNHTPSDGLAAPTVTLSGRQVKPRMGGEYGESILSGAQISALPNGEQAGEDSENPELNGTRPRRGAAAAASRGWASKGRHIEGYNSVDEMDDDEEDASEQDYGDDEEEEEVPLESDVDDADELSDEEDIEKDVNELTGNDKKSMIIKLPVKTPTPEKKSANKMIIDTEPSTANQGTTNPESNAAEVDPAVEVVPSKEAIPAETASKTIGLQSPKAMPWSPSLASRGSPEKPATLPTSINVG